MRTGALWTVGGGVHRDAVLVDEFGAAPRLTPTTRAGRGLRADLVGQPDVNHGKRGPFQHDNDGRGWLLNHCRWIYPPIRTPQTRVGGRPMLYAEFLVAETLRTSSVGDHQLTTDEFLSTVANTRRSETLESARWDVSTVLSTLAEALATDAPNQTLTELSPGFASLLGHPEIRPHSCHARCAHVCRPPSPRPPHRSCFPSSLDVR